MAAIMQGTITDREDLILQNDPKKTGFTPRPIEKYTRKRRPRNLLDVECNHLLRSTTEEFATGYPSLTYRMWLEAGKHQPPIPDKPDPNYNSNVWRNFRENYGFYTTTEGQKISEMIATMYPLNIPAPSKVGDYNYKKFLTETPLIQNPKAKRLAIERVTKDLEDFRKMRLRSEMKNPPLDQYGKIFILV